MTPQEDTAETDKTRQFHLGDLLSITTGRLVSPDRMRGVNRIIEYMTGTTHGIHQIPRGTIACRPYLLEQHPWLGEVTIVEEFRDQEHVQVWLAALVVQYGEYHSVAPLPSGAYVGREPITEFAEMMNRPDRLTNKE